MEGRERKLFEDWCFWHDQEHPCEGCEWDERLKQNHNAHVSFLTDVDPGDEDQEERQYGWGV